MPHQHSDIMWNVRCQYGMLFPLRPLRSRPVKEGDTQVEEVEYGNLVLRRDTGKTVQVSPFVLFDAFLGDDVPGEARRGAGPAGEGGRTCCCCC